MREENLLQQTLHLGQRGTRGNWYPYSTFNFQPSIFNLQGLMLILTAPLLFILSRASW